MTPEEMTLRLNSETDRQTDRHTEAGGWSDKQIEHGGMVTHRDRQMDTQRLHMGVGCQVIYEMLLYKRLPCDRLITHRNARNYTL